MKKTELDAFRMIITRRIEELTAKCSSCVAANPGMPVDSMERASLESDCHLNIVMRERERAELRQYEQALERIKIGTYGICDECDGEINTARLEKQPLATLCIRCKSLEELKERGKSHQLMQMRRMAR